jgi:hypothetical protein
MLMPDRRPGGAGTAFRRRAERTADDVFEDGPISMLADACAWVSDHQGLNEFTRCDPGEHGGPLAERQQPIGDRIGRTEVPRIQVVPPPVGGGQALPEPSVEAEWRQRRRVDAGDQRPLLSWCDNRFAPRQACRARTVEQIGLVINGGRYTGDNPTIMKRYAGK